MLRLSLSQGRAHTHICPDRIAFSQVDRHVHTLLRSSIYSAAYVSQRLYSTRRRRRAVETWLKDVPEHRKEALEFERLLGLRKGIKHKDAPLLNVEESKNLMEIRAKGNERNMRKLEKFKKLAPRQQTKALWYSANKAPLIRQKVVAKQLQDKMDGMWSVCVLVVSEKVVAKQLKEDGW
ncbi:hypothetical protein SARC_11142 [Sphaeroforma arctica JP610]|uniref:Uncharacterized protein n=1 Tax=Sphaeroforma arctica JP610 TaxID=667725 RepID=A0A0L0FHT5_9EUKA|nr:hypothetical protein SARC_11142 [Sphaeroforma arctica JP610]KNC76349.1 hypothetical protein SARC_11142 [Sphaeroforma arctica JP610]|eukprot:XP_014150251.1 hypothetical protein SARC_11142 [Sphaeroforma arctica JP610]